MLVLMRSPRTAKPRRRKKMTWRRKRRKKTTVRRPTSTARLSRTGYANADNLKQD
jgi:hypothetical protein